MGMEEIVTPTDQELVAAARGGESEAFDALMRRYERLVYRVAHGFVCEREAALDLSQAIFLKVFRSLDGFRGESSFKTWLLRIAYHESINETKRAGRRESEELDAEHPRLAAPPEQESVLLAAERRGVLARALGGLHHRYRAAVVLRYHEGLPIRDIAAMLDCSETMTKNLLHRGVRRLREAVVEAL
jgi:RNA polymerase sigma-70 factor (ECF subfamily)